MAAREIRACGIRARPRPVSRRVHRGRYDRQSPRHDRADPGHLQHPAGPAATICPARPPGPYRPCSPSGATSSPRSSASVQIRRHDHVPARLTPSTRTTNTSGPTWPPCSATWASSPAQPRHSPFAKPNLWRSWNLKRLSDLRCRAGPVDRHPDHGAASSAGQRAPSLRPPGNPLAGLMHIQLAPR